MPTSDENETKLWVETWLKAGPKLEAIRRRELRNFDYRKHYEAIDALLEIGCRFAKPRSTSGLVEQQRLFMKART